MLVFMKCPCHSRIADRKNIPIHLLACKCCFSHSSARRRIGSRTRTQRLLVVLWLNLFARMWSAINEQLWLVVEPKRWHSYVSLYICIIFTYIYIYTRRNQEWSGLGICIPSWLEISDSSSQVSGHVAFRFHPTGRFQCHKLQGRIDLDDLKF